LKDLGAHPEDGEPVKVLDGRFGPYVKHGKINASLPKGADPETLALDEAVEILAQKAAKTGGKTAARKSNATNAGKGNGAAKTAAGKGAAAKAKSGKSTSAKPRAASGAKSRNGRAARGGDSGG